MVLLWLPMLAALALPTLLMRLLFGAGYAAGGTLLALLTVGVLVETLLGFKDQSLVALGRERELVWLRTAAQGVGIAVLLVLAPRFGAVGAALAVLAMQAVRSAGLTLLLARSGALPPGRELPGAVWGALALGAAAWAAARGLAPAFAATVEAGTGTLTRGALLSGALTSGRVWAAVLAVAAGGGAGMLLLARAALRLRGSGLGSTLASGRRFLHRL